MSINDTPSSERLHIGFFGCRNAGKSSLVNAVTGQELAIVSDLKGTTTDPVLKAMELLPLGPVVIIDTPGLDDEGVLGEQRVKKSHLILNKTDLAVLVIDGTVGMTDNDQDILSCIQSKGIPHVIAINKSDLPCRDELPTGPNVIRVSAIAKNHINELKELISSKMQQNLPERHLLGGLVRPLDVVVLVVPIDKAAPKGRIILPQQQTLRDALDTGAIVVVVRDTELPQALERLERKPDFVVTDSQVFKKVAAIVPEDVLLTSFSILMARYKGTLEASLAGIEALRDLPAGARILISEGCTHHRQCNDIGTVKLPNWIRAYTGRDFQFEYTSGGTFPEDLSPYSLIIHCGGCMLNEKEMRYRAKCAADQRIPMTNYGIAIAEFNGILDRAKRPLGRLDS